eukprot:5718106-Pyramimonas_sp.AAC.2
MASLLFIVVQYLEIVPALVSFGLYHLLKAFFVWLRSNLRTPADYYGRPLLGKGVNTLQGQLTACAEDNNAAIVKRVDKNTTSARRRKPRYHRSDVNNRKASSSTDKSSLRDARFLRRMMFEKMMRQSGCIKWELMDAASLHNRPLRLLAVMVFGPRWNTHAVIASTPSFKVHKGGDHLQIHTPTASRSARAWTVVVYDRCI